MRALIVAPRVVPAQEVQRPTTTMTRESLQARLEATADVSVDDDASADDRDECLGKGAVVTSSEPQPSKAERQITLTGREPDEPAKKNRKTSASKVAPKAAARAPGGKQPGTKQPGAKSSEVKQEYTVYEILAGDCPLPKVHLYHAQMRLPKRLEGADVATKKELTASMAAMISAVALAPSALLTLGDDELQTHVAAVKAVLPTKSWPPTVFEHLTQRRCSAHLHQPSAFFRRGLALYAGGPGGHRVRRVSAKDEPDRATEPQRCHRPRGCAPQLHHQGPHDDTHGRRKRRPAQGIGN